ncbi:hypothetical protein CWI85_28500 [Streptomyces albidoflavus]|uniref:Uncharacterized protein n=1 Tax=Streptomyces odorifer TaxID=53450 RepID=A0A7Y6F4W9_9ACTN|nr:hypothetical protein [Streptomyces odorifer]NUV31934.1 hypothetical protein [Streptomyces odorifer]PJT47339.1 hypothetical protein CWI85_28530 [Streptomyces albidoflavus]PJT47345.1 hypothetical protein CWI85_28500 [Streptomyces albidoflavus]
MSTLIRRTPADLLAQRDRLLAEVHMTADELRDRAEVHTLSARELAVWHTIEGIDYLLGG